MRAVTQINLEMTVRRTQARLSPKGGWPCYLNVNPTAHCPPWPPAPLSWEEADAPVGELRGVNHGLASEVLILPWGRNRRSGQRAAGSKERRGEFYSIMACLRFFQGATAAAKLREVIHLSFGRACGAPPIPWGFGCSRRLERGAIPARKGRVRHLDPPAGALLS